MRGIVRRLIILRLLGFWKHEHDYDYRAETTIKGRGLISANIARVKIPRSDS